VEEQEQEEQKDDYDALAFADPPDQFPGLLSE